MFLKQHITDFLFGWLDAFDRRARLGIYEGRKLLSEYPDECERPGALDGVEEVTAGIVISIVESCVDYTKQHHTTLVTQQCGLDMVCVVNI